MDFSVLLSECDYVEGFYFSWAPLESAKFLQSCRVLIYLTCTEGCIRVYNCNARYMDGYYCTPEPYYIDRVARNLRNTVQIHTTNQQGVINVYTFKFYFAHVLKLMASYKFITARSGNSPVLYFLPMNALCSNLDHYLDLTFNIDYKRNEEEETGPDSGLELVLSREVYQGRYALTSQKNIPPDGSVNYKELLQSQIENYEKVKELNVDIFAKKKKDYVWRGKFKLVNDEKVWYNTTFEPMVSSKQSWDNDERCKVSVKLHSANRMVHLPSLCATGMNFKFVFIIDPNQVAEKNEKAFSSRCCTLFSKIYSVTSLATEYYSVFPLMKIKETDSNGKSCYSLRSFTTESQLSQFLKICFRLQHRPLFARFKLLLEVISYILTKNKGHKNKGEHIVVFLFSACWFRDVDAEYVQKKVAQFTDFNFSMIIIKFEDERKDNVFDEYFLNTGSSYAYNIVSETDVLEAKTIKQIGSLLFYKLCNRQREYKTLDHSSEDSEDDASPEPTDTRSRERDK